MKRNILDYNFPQDLKSMSDKELELLSYSIRDFLIDKVSKTGGHLASNLGVVELSIALHKVFDSPKDKIIWDVVTNPMFIKFSPEEQVTLIPCVSSADSAVFPRRMKVFMTPLIRGTAAHLFRQLPVWHPPEK